MMGAGGGLALTRFAAERLVRAVESGPDGVLMLDPAGTVQFANSSAVAMLGARDRVGLLGAPWLTLWGEPDRAAARVALEAAAAGGTGRFVASTHTEKSGQRRLDIAVSAQRDAAGEPEGLLVVSRDVTELEAARLAAEARERAGAEEAARQRSVAAMVSLASWETDFRRNIVRRGDAGGIREIPLEEAMNRYAPETRALFWERTERVRLSRETRREEVPYTRTDGARGWFREYCEPIVEDDVCVGLRGAAMDISEEVAAREATERAEQRLQLAIELAGMEVFELDFDQQSLAPAGSWETILQDPLREEDIWPDPFRTVDPRDQARVRAAWAEALETQTPMRCEFRIHGRDGQEAWVYCVAEILQEGGRPKRALTALLDITERKRCELEILQTMAQMREHEAQQKLLLDELNHRVKNTLASVQSVAVQTLGGGRDLQDARDLFIDRLLALSTTHNLLVKRAWTSASFRELVTATLAPYGHAWRYEGPDFRLAPNFAVTLGMVVHELATNAIKHGAWRGGGQIDIATAVEHGEARITWKESGGPLVYPPMRRGFGSRLLQRGVGGELGGRVRIEFPPEGAICHIQAQLSPRLRLADCDTGGD
ncbi:PAS domain-containing protein [Phenylobacterium sp. LjRoot225]|uniref:PAS domain-containing sensor histidine kinase n=1 Tax=Phenylobacterium sp. LjRoot225 TaxID=3342285 RepID=UPI003ED09F82